jgi:hypothetical protein
MLRSSTVVRMFPPDKKSSVSTREKFGSYRAPMSERPCVGVKVKNRSRVWVCSSFLFAGWLHRAVVPIATTVDRQHTPQMTFYQFYEWRGPLDTVIICPLTVNTSCVIHIIRALHASIDNYHGNPCCDKQRQLSSTTPQRHNNDSIFQLVMLSHSLI